MNKYSEPLFQKSNFSPPGMINFSNICITYPKTFNLSLGVAGKGILTLSALYRSCQFLPLSDRTTKRNCMLELPRLESMAVFDKILGVYAKFPSVHITDHNQA